MISKENETAVKFVLSSPENLKTAQVVYDSWSDVLGRVGPTFLHALSGRIEAAVKERETLKAFAHDILRPLSIWSKSVQKQRPAI